MCKNCECNSKYDCYTFIGSKCVECVKTSGLLIGFIDFFFVLIELFVIIYGRVTLLILIFINSVIMFTSIFIHKPVLFSLGRQIIFKNHFYFNFFYFYFLFYFLFYFILNLYYLFYFIIYFIFIKFLFYLNLNLFYFYLFLFKFICFYFKSLATPFFLCSIIILFDVAYKRGLKYN